MPAEKKHTVSSPVLKLGTRMRTKKPNRDGKLMTGYVVSITRGEDGIKRIVSNITTRNQREFTGTDIFDLWEVDTEDA